MLHNIGYVCSVQCMYMYTYTDSRNSGNQPISTKKLNCPKQLYAYMYVHLHVHVLVHDIVYTCTCIYKYMCTCVYIVHVYILFHLVFSFLFFITILYSVYFEFSVLF